MNEQNGQVDIEEVKDRIRASLEVQPRSDLLYIAEADARALLAHLERVEGVEQAVKVDECRLIFMCASTAARRVLNPDADMAEYLLREIGLDWDAPDWRKAWETLNEFDKRILRECGIDMPAASSEEGGE